MSHSFLQAIPSEIINSPRLLKNGATELVDLDFVFPDEMPLMVGPEQYDYFKEFFLIDQNHAHYFEFINNRFLDIKYLDYKNNQTFLFSEGFLLRDYRAVFKHDIEACIGATKSDRLYSDFDIRLFVGRAGHVAHMHFDWKAKNNVFIQIQGEKKITLAHPQFSSQLGLAGLVGDMGPGVRDIVTEVYLKAGDILIIPPFFGTRWKLFRILSACLCVPLVTGVEATLFSTYLRAFSTSMISIGFLPGRCRLQNVLTT